MIRNNTPLIILDGMQFYGELSEINPEDIGQIDVLKDARLLLSMVRRVPMVLL